MVYWAEYWSDLFPVESVYVTLSVVDVKFKNTTKISILSRRCCQREMQRTQKVEVSVTYRFRLGSQSPVGIYHEHY
jgi:hypothetical protein